MKRIFIFFNFLIIQKVMAQIKPEPLDPVIAASKAPKADEPVKIINLKNI